MRVSDLALAACWALLLATGCNLFDSDRQDFPVLVHAEDALSIAIGARSAEDPRIPDREDNCLAHPNPAQRDSDGFGFDFGFGFGNRCDPDVDDDGLVDTA